MTHATGTSGRPYMICTRCIMDTSDPDITFDAHGVCNHCVRYEQQARARTFPPAERDTRLNALVEQMKRDGAGKDYDCIIGVSGGVDSTYVAYLTKQLGLRPLAVHFDNGWNSELAVSNIEKTLKTLDIDLYTYVVDWEEFRDLQVSFLRGSTPDGEVPTDHAIMALLYSACFRNDVRYILLGTNVASEAIMPVKWGYGYSDLRYIKAVHRKFGSKPLRTYPSYSLLRMAWNLLARRIRIVPILDLVDYQKEEAMRLIEAKLGWVYYGGKHYESIYTRWYQAFVLPRKFNIDKRRAHLSNLVLSGQSERDAAIELLKQPVYPAELLAQDTEYAVKKLGLSETDFKSIMAAKPLTFENYPNTKHYWELAKRARNRIKGQRRQAQ